jgi:poly-gamma-glutamate capsule biosynthesis protein CapA/YwtB (metallophosphatase superfamily)
MKIIFGGDFFIDDYYQDRNLFDDSIISLMSNSDYRIVNLESPIVYSKEETKINKTGPHIRSSYQTTIPFLKTLGINIVSLANNHILDYGDNGLEQTLRALDHNNIKYVGAGNNIAEASSSITINGEGINIAILNFAEKEWSIADTVNGGANPLCVIDNLKQIEEAKKNHDKVICIIHGGHEHYELPSPNMIKLYRFYAERGADAIIGHHTHCISGFEIFKDVPIFYSLGNFIFTKKSNNENWYTGLLVELILSNDKPIHFNLHPVHQEKDSFLTSRLFNDGKKRVIENISKLNTILADELIVESNWNLFVQNNQANYLVKVSPLSGMRNKYLKYIVNIMGINKLLINTKYLMYILVFIKCRSHSEFLSKMIELKLTTKK